MKIGTKSILFGVHQFFIHPWFVALGWWKIYGFPKDYRLWVAFFVHDLGYWNKPNMDGPEGETHPYLGAKIMQNLFGNEWWSFTFYHSRFLAKKDGVNYSKLCVADKASIYLTPKWLYIFLGKLSGEIYEYIKHSKYNSMNMDRSSIKTFHRDMCEYLKKWVKEHKEIKEDKWTGIK